MSHPELGLQSESKDPYNTNPARLCQTVSATCLCVPHTPSVIPEHPYVRPQLIIEA